MEEKVKRVIESWLVVEYLSTGKLPYADDQKPLFEGAQTTLDKFQQIKEGNKSFIYLGIYRSYRMAELIRKFYKDESEIYNEDKSLNYSLSIQLNDQGRYIENSLFIPQIQFLLKEILSKSFNIATLEELNKATQRAVDTLEKELQLIFKNGVSFETLEKAQTLIQNYFGLEKLLDKEIYTLLDMNSQNEPVEVNSLIVSDLENILTNQKLSPTLEKYIKGENQFEEIDENQDLITKLLEIDSLPDGRWPSNNNYKLSLMQQVAVTIVLNEKKDVFSVNGPPGTGKTTLLKDIFANLLIERAQNMAKFRNPTKAKKYTGKIDLNGFTIHKYELDETIKGYGIVVASSNNGAVENISKDLPKSKEIIHTEDHFSKEDEFFSEMIKEVNLFPEYVKYIFDSKPTKNSENLFQEHWGLFSVPMGKQTNITNLFDVLLGKTQLEDGTIEPSLYDKLKEDKFKQSDWDEACQKFSDIQKQILNEKSIIKLHNQLGDKRKTLTKKLADIQRNILEFTQKSTKINQEIKFNEEAINKLNQKKSLLPKTAWYVKLARLIIGKEDPIIADIDKKIVVIMDDNESLSEELNQLQKQKEILNQKYKAIEQQLEETKQKLKGLDQRFVNDEYQVPNHNMWETENYDERQKSVPWQTKRLNYLRGAYFIQSLKIHKLFNQANASIFFSAFTVINRRKELNLNNQEDRALLQESWSIFHLLIPVVSTTFASLGNMYRGMGIGSIDYLFIDEAGQATPQAAAGGIWRAKHVIAVGDPSQIEPVVTLEDSLFKTVQEAYELEAKYLSKTASVQRLSDEANSYGTIKPNGDRIGTPLWVHRRCLNPMFHVSNIISYDSKMVQGALFKDADKGQLSWLDVKGKVKGKQYVEEQAIALFEQIKNKKSLQNVYVISPFKAVVDRTKRYINAHASQFEQISVADVKAWSKQAIGTVHTFQGKEEEIVYFICGTDETTDGAANWSCQKPNLLNVAITRAKNEFIVIGDYDRFKTKANYQVVAEYVN